MGPDHVGCYFDPVLNRTCTTTGRYCTARLTQTDPSFKHARQSATQEKDSRYTGPRFEWQGPLLYRIYLRQLVVPTSLHPRLLFLVHEVQLAGHQAADKTLAQLTLRFY